jgi:hypothetical protein
LRWKKITANNKTAIEISDHSNYSKRQESWAVKILLFKCFEIFRTASSLDVNLLHVHIYCFEADSTTPVTWPQFEETPSCDKYPAVCRIICWRLFRRGSVIAVPTNLSPSQTHSAERLMFSFSFGWVQFSEFQSYKDQCISVVSFYITHLSWNVGLDLSEEIPVLFFQYTLVYQS